MKQGTQQMKDLEVDRVDGVDKPATGLNFLLFKSKDGAPVEKADGAAARVATAANAVLKAIRKDSKATVSRKSAIALNGLAQVFGQDAVFVGKSVPTQPYEFSEPDEDKRGPADEKLGSNFVARAAAMIDATAIKMKAAEDEDEDDEMIAADKGADKGADEKKMPWEKAVESMAKSVEAMAKAQLTPDAIAKAVIAAAKAEDVTKSEDEGDEPVKKSRQVQVDDEPIKRAVRKSDYEPRLGVSFANITFGDKK